MARELCKLQCHLYNCSVHSYYNTLSIVTMYRAGVYLTTFETEKNNVLYTHTYMCRSLTIKFLKQKLIPKDVVQLHQRNK